MRRINSAVVTSAILIFAGASQGAIIAGWDFSPLTGGAGNFGPSPYAATTTGSNVTVGGLVRGSGILTPGSSTGAANAWGGNDLTGANQAAAITNSDFATISVTTDSGFQTSFSDIGAFNIRHSGTGPTTGIFQYSIDAGSYTDIGSSFSYGAVTTSAGNPIASIDLSGISALQNVAGGSTVNFRIASWGATGTTGTWYLNDPLDTTAIDFSINGATSAIPEPATLAGAAAMGLVALRRRR